MLLYPHQERVVKEKEELDEKLEKLLRFFMGDVYKKLDEAEQDRLSNQATAMKRYSDILGERIAAF